MGHSIVCVGHFKYLCERIVLFSGAIRLLVALRWKHKYRRRLYYHPIFLIFSSLAAASPQRNHIIWMPMDTSHKYCFQSNLHFQRKQTLEFIQSTRYTTKTTIATAATTNKKLFIFYDLSFFFFQYFRMRSNRYRFDRTHCFCKRFSQIESACDLSNLPPPGPER